LFDLRHSCQQQWKEQKNERSKEGEERKKQTKEGDKSVVEVKGDEGFREFTKIKLEETGNTVRRRSFTNVYVDTLVETLLEIENFVLVAGNAEDSFELQGF